MKTSSVRLYGAFDLRLEEFELPPIRDDEVLIRVVSDSACMSTYKAVSKGAAHKRVPDDVDQHPIVVGHEMCGEIIQVGERLRGEWRPGEKVVVQPALNLPGSDYSVGYSFPYIGGNMTYAIVPQEVLKQNCLLRYQGDSFFEGSLAEPLSCILRSFKSSYHTDTKTFVRTDGTKKNGKIAILGGAGPMGIGALDIALHYASPSMVVVTDIDSERLSYAEHIFLPQKYKDAGIELHFVDVSKISDQEQYLRELSGTGFDDVFVMLPNQEVLELGNKILGLDGCLNFFAGPTDTQLSAEINYYRIHYDFTHIMGTSGGMPQDMVDVLHLIEEGVLHPAAMITHIGGLDSTIKTIESLPEGKGLKKIVYPSLRMEMTALTDLATNGKDMMRDRLAELVEAHGGLWSREAEAYLLKHINAD